MRSMLATVAAALLLATPASAQYFGQNKVQYDDFDWRVISTDHFDFHFYPETREASVQMARAAERWEWRLSRVFDHRLSERKPVIMYANHPDFQQTNIIESEIGIGTGGVTDALRNRATQPYTGDFHGSSHVVGHELAHVFQYDIAAAGPGLRAMSRLPLWLIEGMAEYLTVGRIDPHTAMWMRDAVIRGDIPSVSDLSGGRFFPYRYGQALLAYVGGRWGDRAVTDLYKVGLTEGLEQAILQVTGLTSEQLSEAWATSLRESYLPTVADRDAPEDVGRPLLERTARRGDVNLAPVLSPDGRRVAFISERGLFSMDLYVANVETGEIERRLTSSEREPHFYALNFLESAGTWSPDGRYFAYVVVDDGDNELRIADVGTGRTIQQVEVGGVSALNDPAWSPDGRRVAFSGSSDGISDLYVFDLDSREATQLTSGLDAELHPSWSPDGSTLVFVTDRGAGTEPELLQFGPLRLATIELDTRTVRLLPSFEGAKHIDPHYSPDGRSILFISDRDGVSDIFRLDLNDGSFYRVTRTATGISGVTPHSPALTVAARTGRLAFSIFGNNRYTLHALDPDQAIGVRVTGSGSVAPAGVLPPATPDLDAGIVQDYLASPAAGLPSGAEYAISDYDPSLSLDYIGPPTIAASVDQFGAQFGGAVSFYFGDLLGNRRLAVLAQAQGEVEDVGAQVMYQNRENRLNWALLAGRVPYRSGRRAVERTTVDGQSALLVRDQVFRTFLNQASGQLSYPFSRSRRVEGRASYTLYTFDAEERQFLCTASGQDCDLVSEEALPGVAPDGVHLFRTGAAWVGDWTTFGFTGPVVGGRFRFDVEPTFGDLQFIAGLADYRRYFFWNPVTLAVRGLHYGRYGRDAERDGFLSPLFLGSGDLVRGYTISSFRSSECAGLNGGDGCPEFDRLVGSRVGVTNIELRVPLFGTADFGLIPFPYLPTTIGAFVDAGVAWTADEAPELEFATESTGRIPVTSAGAFARVNVLGYMVVSTWLAHPFQRPQRDWVFGLQLAPGW